MTWTAPVLVAIETDPREEEKTMKAMLKSVKHVRYALGSMTAVMFAGTAGAAF